MMLLCVAVRFGLPLDGIGRSGSSPDFHVGSGDEVVARWRHSSERHSDREVQQGGGKRLVSGVLTEARAHFRKEMEYRESGHKPRLCMRSLLHIPPIEKEVFLRIPPQGYFLFGPLFSRYSTQ